MSNWTVSKYLVTH